MPWFATWECHLAQRFREFHRRKAVGVNRLHRDMRVLCVCRNGQVRSVAARYILADWYGFRRVLACGWALNDAETLGMLCSWAEAVLLVGRPSQWYIEAIPANKCIPVEIGPDTYGDYRHHELLKLLVPRIEALLDADTIIGVTPNNRRCKNY